MQNSHIPEENLLFKNSFVWSKLTKEEKEKALRFANEYMDWLKIARTERERVNFAVKVANEKGFTQIFLGKNPSTLKPGDKVYYVNRNKNIALAIIGKSSMKDRINIIGAHIDTPRIDLKINPLYEDEKTGFALFKTHYYGGIKKYQWATIPLALTGVIAKIDGSIINVEIGLKPEDPVFMIPDLLIHLSQTVQADRKTGDVIKAEEMNVLAGALEFNDEKVKEKFKIAILKILNEQYKISESDFLSAELSLVSALSPRLVGLDRSMIGAAGQDDGACAYTSMRSVLDFEGIPEHTIITALFDKEEIGSNGNTGAQSSWFRFVVNDLMIRTSIPDTNMNLNVILNNSKIISADVTAAMDPSFPSVHDPKTAAIFGKGVVITKYTGRGGKYDSSDAGAEYMAEIRGIFEKGKISYQVGTLGAVDAGGGGTIAKYFAENFNADVVDIGPALINMHSPFEISHIADIYSTYLSYIGFFKV